MASLLAVLGVLALLVGTAAPAQARSRDEHYRVQVLAGLERATAVNDHGVVVGTARTAKEHERAAVWSPRTRRTTVLGTLGGFTSSAAAVNERGQVAGSADTSDGQVRAVRWEPGRRAPRDLGTLGGNSSRAYGIDHRGRVVGESETASGQTHAFLWSPATGRMRDLGILGGDGSVAYAISDRGVVVGDASTAEGLGHAVRWTGGDVDDLGLLPGTVVSFGRDVNRDGDVVGFATSTADGSSMAFRQRDGRGPLRPLTGLPAGSSEARAVDERGRVLVALATETSSRGLVWRSGEVDELAPLDTGAEVFPAGLSDRGVAVGVARDADGDLRAVRWVRS